MAPQVSRRRAIVDVLVETTGSVEFGARVLLDIPRWDFHWQNAYVLVKPVQLGRLAKIIAGL